jgi:glyoxylase-like metal-dependent hydrolase (beta-lactamase superfamily II)
MKIAEGIEMLELNLGSSTIHPVVLIDADSWTLIDTGMPGSATAIRELAKLADIGNRPLRTILLTHQDLDHVGGLPEFIEEEAPIVYAHPGDESAINGTEPMIKMSPERVAGLLGQLPEKIRHSYERTFIQPTRPNVTRSFSDGEILPYGGGLTVIHTPGHTPGHVSLYHHSSKTLITGDATIAVNGALAGPNEAYTPNMEQALESLKKFKAYDIEKTICYHGGLVLGPLRERIDELTERRI